jgi:hypothetical protein
MSAMASRRWHAGETALLRFVSDTTIWGVQASKVAHDTADLLALYWSHGYPRKIPPGDRLAFRRRWLSKETGFSHIDGAWNDLSVLCLMRPDEAHATWVVHRETAFLGWYINLQKPLSRSGVGFDTLDYTLDLIIRPDMTYRWKDEDEFAEDIEHGIFTPEEGLAIRAEGERVLADALNGESPFCDGWEAWRPDPAWSVPQIPNGWDRLRPA